MAHLPANVPASDSVNPFPLRLMSHEFTLLTPLHPFSCFHALPTSLSFSIIIKSHAGTQGRNGPQYKRPFSASRVFLERSLQSQAFNGLPLRGLLTFLQSVNSAMLRPTYRMHTHTQTQKHTHTTLEM